ncbi:protein kinase [Candidatus Uabimicrobium sp. HlEnr_7]|uniref:serine/threonine protein kinase n=1 Tax=Candidatus Uabimicrobium helgolandensis TaxID=3095367 RepID=UPI00355817B5
MLFGEIAISKKWITQGKLEEALEIQKQKNSWLIGEILCFLNYLKEEQVEELLKIQNNSHRKTNANVYFGRYKILHEIGRGGMGRVFKAHDPHLDREVALKVLKYGEGASEIEIERFIREARATAKLRHPHIVTLYDIGHENEQNFFTMDFISGVSLRDSLRSNPLTIEQIIVIMIKVTQAVGYAHSCGIVHRDIKPSNIMLDENKEPKVMDFGLAKMNSHDSISKTGDVLGTPAYMSPEQAKSDIVDKRSDIYSLGVTLHELLTGRPPFIGTSYLDVLYQVVHREPLSLRSFSPQTPIAVDAICFKCLEKNPRKRYQNTAEFIKDLQHFLHDKPVSAKWNKWRKIKNFLHYRKTLVFIIIVLALVIVALTTVVIYQHKQILQYKNLKHKTKD